MFLHNLVFILSKDIILDKGKVLHTILPSNHLVTTCGIICSFENSILVWYRNCFHNGTQWRWNNHTFKRWDMCVMWMRETYTCMLAHPTIFFHISTKHLKNIKKTDIVELHFFTPTNVDYHLELEAARNILPIVSLFNPNSTNKHHKHPKTYRNLFGTTWCSHDV